MRRLEARATRAGWTRGSVFHGPVRHTRYHGHPFMRGTVGWHGREGPVSGG